MEIEYENLEWMRFIAKAVRIFAESSSPEVSLQVQAAYYEANDLVDGDEETPQPVLEFMERVDAAQTAKVLRLKKREEREQLAREEADSQEDGELDDSE